MNWNVERNAKKPSVAKAEANRLRAALKVFIKELSARTAPAKQQQQ